MRVYVANKQMQTAAWRQRQRTAATAPSEMLSAAKARKTSIRYSERVFTLLFTVWPAIPKVAGDPEKRNGGRCCTPSIAWRRVDLDHSRLDRSRLDAAVQWHHHLLPSERQVLCSAILTYDSRLQPCKCTERVLQAGTTKSAQHDVAKLLDHR